MTSILTKTLAACGLIAVSASAMADANSVSIYGRVDAAVESIKTAGERTNGVNNSGSLIGFQGVENLGGGLKAGFILEHSFNIDDGANSDTDSFFNSRSELFLGGNFGTVRMGRFLSPSYYAVADTVSLHNADYGITADALYAFVGLDTNRLAYTSPEMNGLTLESSVSFHERANQNSTDKKAYDLAATYNLGNWAFAAGYSEHGDDEQYAVRATWSQDAWTVSGYHQRSEVDGYQAHVNRIAAAYTVGAGELHANFGQAHGEGQHKAQQWTVGYNHNLSKRTKVYALYSQVTNKHGAAFGGEAINGQDFASNQDRKSVSVGIRHNF